MDFEKLTNKSKELMQDVINYAVASKHQYISPLHLLKILLDLKDGPVLDLVLKSGGSMMQIRERLDAALKRIPAVEGQSVQSLMNQELPV